MSANGSFTRFRGDRIVLIPNNLQYATELNIPTAIPFHILKNILAICGHHHLKQVHVEVEEEEESVEEALFSLCKKYLEHLHLKMHKDLQNGTRVISGNITL